MCKNAIVLGTYNRGHLLKRSLYCYGQQLEKDVTGIVIIDDGSTDDTYKIAIDASENYNLNIFYFRLPEKQPGQWRDSASFLNMGISFALHYLNADFVFITHPEIMPGRNTMSAALHFADLFQLVWLSFKGYYLTAEQQAQIDTVNWQSDRMNLETIPGFFECDPAILHGPVADYQHVNISRAPVWLSWIFGGGHRRMWDRLGGLNESNFWGVVDIDLVNRRHLLGIETKTPQGKSEWVIHQNHDNPETDTVTPRDMDQVFANLPKYRTAEDASLKFLLNPERFANE